MLLIKKDLIIYLEKGPGNGNFNHSGHAAQARNNSRPALTTSIRKTRQEGFNQWVTRNR